MIEVAKHGTLQTSGAGFRYGGSGVDEPLTKAMYSARCTIVTRVRRKLHFLSFHRPSYRGKGDPFSYAWWSRSDEYGCPGAQAFAGQTRCVAMYLAYAQLPSQFLMRD